MNVSLASDLSFFFLTDLRTLFSGLETRLFANWLAEIRLPPSSLFTMPSPVYLKNVRACGCSEFTENFWQAFDPRALLKILVFRFLLFLLASVMKLCSRLLSSSFFLLFTACKYLSPMPISLSLSPRLWPSVWPLPYGALLSLCRLILSVAFLIKVLPRLSRYAASCFVKRCGLPIGDLDNYFSSSSAAV